MSRIYLTPPDVIPSDVRAVAGALESGWVAPLGPEVDAFEDALASVTERSHAVALSSGTAALHLALLLEGIGPGDRVAVSTLTFSATVNAIRYVGADPVFIDSEYETWNIDPELLASALVDMDISACIVVDIYGQAARYELIVPILEEHGVALIEDAAEALGATRGGRPAGSFGSLAALSFNGNKIITTSGGGALLTDNRDWAERARYLATQARDPAPHYQHSEIGYNYRMSNILAALGRSQLADLDRRVAVRRDHYAAYRSALGELPGVSLMPEAPGGCATFWLTCMTIAPDVAGVSRESVRLHLESLDIESRPVWKPMHLQPVFSEHAAYGGRVSEHLFDSGLCLPSGSSLSPSDRQRVIDGVLSVFNR